MKESDYIKVTNLAKARIALEIMKDILPAEDDYHKINVAKMTIARYIIRLEKDLE